MRSDQQAQLLKLQSVRLPLTISLIALTGALFDNIIILLVPDLMAISFPPLKKVFVSLSIEQMEQLWPHLINASQYVLTISAINVIILIPLALAPTTSNMKSFSALLMVTSSLAIVCYILIIEFISILYANSIPPVEIDNWPLFIIIPFYTVGVTTAVTIIIYTLYRNIYHSPMSVIASHINAD